VRDGLRAPSLGLDPSRADQDAPHHRAVEGGAALRRSPALLVEDRRDRHAIATLPVKFAGPRDQLRIGAERFQLGHWPHDLQRGPIAALPMAFQADLFAVAEHGDDDPLQQQSRYCLTLLPRRRLGPPKGGQILGQVPDSGQFGWRRRFGPLLQETFVVGQETRLLAVSQSCSRVRATSRFSGSTLT